MSVLLCLRSIPALPRGPASSSSSSNIHQKTFFPPSFSRNLSIRITMSSSHSLPPLPEQHFVVGCGSVGVGVLATLASYPQPDDKIRSTSLKVANDTQGRGILEGLEADGVETFFFVVSEEGNSPFTYIIVDNKKKTRTCIHSPGYSRMVPSDLSHSKLVSALEGARIVYFDGRLHETALVVAQEAICRNIPLLMDAERVREGLNNLLELADYAVCAAKFLQWTRAPSIASSLVSVMLRLPKLKIVVVTLGEEGCLMLERMNDNSQQAEEVDVNNLLEILKQQKDSNIILLTCVASSVTKLRAEGIGSISGRLLLGTVEKIPSSELVDTTSAGDAFIAICADMPPEKMLPFAAQVLQIVEHEELGLVSHTAQIHARYLS